MWGTVLTQQKFIGTSKVFIHIAYMILWLIRTSECEFLLRPCGRIFEKFDRKIFTKFAAVWQNIWAYVLNMRSNVFHMRPHVCIPYFQNMRPHISTNGHMSNLSRSDYLNSNLNWKLLKYCLYLHNISAIMISIMF